jgi:hypothetical protein
MVVIMNKILVFDLNEEKECMRFAQMVAALNAAGVTYEVNKERGEHIATIEVGMGY